MNKHDLKDERMVTFKEIKQLYKPRLKAMSKNMLINLIVDLGIQITELQQRIKGAPNEESINTDTVSNT